MMMRTSATVSDSEKRLIRTIAVAQRPLDKNMQLTPLQAIDRLQRLANKFRDEWLYPAPWLVLEDCWALPASLPVSQMLDDIEKHGSPIGIVGMAWLRDSKRDVVLKLPFRKDAKSIKTLQTSADGAETKLNDLRKAVFTAEVFVNEAEASISMRYSFLPEQPQLEPGYKKIGVLVFTRGGQVRDCSDENHAADIEQAKERFTRTVNTLREIQMAQATKR